MKPEVTSQPAPDADYALTRTGRWVVLVVALLGWGGSGVLMAITPLIGNSAMIELLDKNGQLNREKYQSAVKYYGTGSKPTRASQVSVVTPPVSPPNGASPTATSSSPPIPAEAMGMNCDPEPPAPDRQQYDAAKTLVGEWFAWLQASMLFGGATGGLLFGFVGDRHGRAKGLTFSILTSAIMSAVAYYAVTPQILCCCWFLACTGLGGMWPNGVALISESWGGMSRITVSGVMGTAANVGLFLMHTLCTTSRFQVTVDDWRWTMLVPASWVVLGIVAAIFLPESPRWLKLHGGPGRDGPAEVPASPPRMGEIFVPPLLWVTLVAIVIATVPTMGGWGSANWMQPWADQVGSAASPPNTALKAQVGQARAFTGIIGSLIGGWVAAAVGRRLMFCLTSLGCLCAAQYTFWYLVPTDTAFLPLVATLGFFSGLYFGWLPLCMPEFFPTRNRSTGAGVSFNFGRIFTATTVFAIGWMMAYFKGDYARIGQITSTIFAVGMIVIWFAPSSREGKLSD